MNSFHTFRLNRTLLATWLLAIVLPASADTFTWTNAVSGNWNNAQNWSPNGIPGGTDIAVFSTPGTYTVSITDNEAVNILELGASSGTVTLNVSGTYTVFTVNGTGTDAAYSALIFSGGILNGSGSITLGGPLTWTGGSIGAIVQCNGGSVNVGFSYLYDGQLINTGALEWTPTGSPTTGNGSVISNASSGTINIALNGQGIQNTDTFAGTSAFYNSGQINISGEGQVGAIEDPFINNSSGMVTINSGTFAFYGPGNNTGTITVNSGAVAQFSGNNTGTITVNSGGSFNVVGGGLDNSGNGTISGQGDLSIGNYTSFNGPGPYQIGTMELTGGGISGTTPVQVQKPGGFTWSGGWEWGTASGISGIVQCNGGSVNVEYADLISGQLINSGTLEWTPTGYPTTGWGSVISNASSGTINIALNGQGIQTDTFAGGASAFYNAGQINISGAGQTGAITDPFINASTGTLTINSGTLNLAPGYNLANGTLNFGISSASSFGQLVLSGALTLNNAALIATAIGYTPSQGDSIPLITYRSETGIFSAFNIPPNANWQPVYGATAFSLNVASTTAPYLTLQVVTPVVIKNGFTLLMLGPPNANYEIQGSTSESSPSWETVASFFMTDSSYYYTDTNAASTPFRIFQAVMPNNSPGLRQKPNP